MRTRLGLFLVLSAALAACDRGPQQAAPTTDTEAAHEAARDACISRVLAERAQEGVAALEEFQMDDSPIAAASRAALEFARALDQHAQLRHAAHAHADSALNHARTPADSARYMQTAQSYLPRAPEPGRVEGNVADAWMRDYATLRADEDHRCNWDI